MSKPRACPFCGSDDVEVVNTEDAYGEYYVGRCSSCGASGPTNLEHLATIGWDYREAVGDDE